MTPRRYHMSTRTAEVSARRTHIVRAAIGLFAEHTAAATTMDDVARAAGVAPATVYRQFKDFDGLARACAETAFHIAEIPTPQAAVEQFAELDSLGAKLQRFIEISCECYQRAHLWLAAERRERHLPAFAQTLSREEAALSAILSGLLDEVTTEPVVRAVVKTLVDFPFWEALHGSGVPSAEIPGVVFRLAADELRRAGVELRRPPEVDLSHPQEKEA